MSKLGESYFALKGIRCPACDSDSFWYLATESNIAKRPTYRCRGCRRCEFVVRDGEAVPIKYISSSTGTTTTGTTTFVFRVSGASEQARPDLDATLGPVQRDIHGQPLAKASPQATNRSDTPRHDHAWFAAVGQRLAELEREKASALNQPPATDEHNG